MSFLRAPPPLPTLLAVGLLLRLLLAYMILPGSGELGDIRWYSQWALAIASDGPGSLYTATDANYPPGYMYILWAVGAASKAMASAAKMNAVEISFSLVKIPPILLDVATALLLHRIARQWSMQDSSRERLALVAAAIYLFNPVVIYDSTIWGQTDAAGTFIILLGVLALCKGPSELAASIAVVSFLIKPQYGVILIPIVTVILLRRHVAPVGWVNALRSRSHWLSRTGPLRIATSATTVLVVFYALILPFNLTARSFLERMVKTAQEYNLLSVNAFNPWAFVGAGGHPPLLLAGIGHCAPDDVPLVGPLTGVNIGAILLACGFLLGVIRLLSRSDLKSIFLVGAYLSVCFFILPTRVHERYVFPAFAFVSVLAAMDRKWLGATIALSSGSFINLHAVLSYIGSDNLVMLPFGQDFRLPITEGLSVVLQTAVLLFSAWTLREGSQRLHPGIYRNSPVQCDSGK